MKKIFLFFLMGILLMGLVSASLTDHLISFYDFDDSDVTLYDNYLGEINGTSSGTITKAVAGLQGDAWRFEGIDGSVWLNPLQVSDNKNFTFSLWTNTTILGLSGTDILIAEANKTGATEYNELQHREASGYKARGEYRNTGEQRIVTGTNVVNDSLWHHYVYSGNTTDILIYFDGVLDSHTTITNNLDTSTTTIGAENRSGTLSSFYNGTMDLLAIYNRSLEDSEITQLYNGGSGFNPVQGGSLGVTLDFPSNGSTVNSLSQEFNVTITSVNLNLTNATIFVWNSSKDLINETTNIVLGNGTTNTTKWDITLFEYGTYHWNVLANALNESDDVISSFANSNSSFSIQQFEIFDSIFSDPVLETSSQNLTLNISSNPGITIQSATLIYNGTGFFGVDKNEFEDNNYSISKEINIPQIPPSTGSQNMSFFWNITTVNEVTGETFQEQSSSFGQNVTELTLNLCGAGSTDSKSSVLNFTMYDESNSTQINAVTNATTFESVFLFGGDTKSLVKNFSFMNQSTNVSNFDFCTNRDGNFFYIDMNSLYGAVDYAESNHFLVNASVNGSQTNEIDLFLLRNSDAVQFFISVEKNLVPFPNVIIQISKLFQGEGIYKTVEIDKTDSSGKISAYLELDRQYKFTVIQDGQVFGTLEKTSICESAPCEISIELSDGFQNIFSGFDNAFATDVVYNLSYDPLEKIIYFDFADTTGLATYFNLQVNRQFANQSGSLISNQSIFTSSGTITFNMTGQPNGDYIAKIYVSRSPAKFIDLISIVLSDAVTLGLLGLLIGFIFILVMVFGLAVSPKMLIIIVPLALTLTKFAGFVIVGNVTLIALWVLATVAFFVIKS